MILTPLLKHIFNYLCLINPEWSQLVHHSYQKHEKNSINPLKTRERKRINSKPRLPWNQPRHVEALPNVRPDRYSTILPSPYLSTWIRTLISSSFSALLLLLLPLLLLLLLLVLLVIFLLVLILLYLLLLIPLLFLFPILVLSWGQ